MVLNLAFLVVLNLDWPEAFLIQYMISVDTLCYEVKYHIQLILGKSSIHLWLLFWSKGYIVKIYWNAPKELPQIYYFQWYTEYSTLAILISAEVEKRMVKKHQVWSVLLARSFGAERMK